MKTLTAATLSLLAACATAQAPTVSYSAPGAEPRFFAPGVITIGGATTYRPTFTPDQLEVYYSLEVGSDYTMLVSQFSRSGWLTPTIVSFSGRYSDAEPFISPDGKRMIFVSKRPVDGGTTAKSDYDLWTSARSADGSWSVPRHLPEVSSDVHDLYPTVAANGNLYFMRAEKEGHDLWMARYENGRYASPVKLPSPPNSDTREGGVFIAPDESYMLFESNRPGGFGGTDLYIAFRIADSWSAPKHLPAPISSPAQETSPIVSGDGKTLYFTSNRRASTPRLGPGAKYEEIIRQLREPGHGGWHTYEVAFDVNAYR